MKQVILYSLKVWITSAVIAVTIIEFNAILIGIGDGLDVFIIGVAACLLVTIPVWLQLIFCSVYLQKTPRRSIYVKLILSITSLVMMFIELLFLNGDIVNVHLLLPYSIVLVGCIWFYKLKLSVDRAIELDE